MWAITTEGNHLQHWIALEMTQALNPQNAATVRVSRPSSQLTMWRNIPLGTIANTLSNASTIIGLSQVSDTCQAPNWTFIPK